MKNICLKTDYLSLTHSVDVAYSESDDGLNTSWSIVDKADEDIPYVPASMFDTEQVMKNGNADLLMKHPFHVDSDLSTIDKVEQSLRQGLDSTYNKFVDDVKSKTKS